MSFDGGAKRCHAQRLRVFKEAIRGNQRLAKKFPKYAFFFDEQELIWQQRLDKENQEE